MIDSCPFRSMSIGPQIRLFQTLTLKKRSRSWVWPKRKPHGWPIIQLTFLFGSHQSDQKFLTWSYFRIWPWKIQDKGWGQRSRSHNWPFLRYGQTSIFLQSKCLSVPQPWPWVKVILYIFPDLYFRGFKYLRWNTDGFAKRSESLCGCGGGGNELKTVTPDWGDLMKFECWYFQRMFPIHCVKKWKA